MAFDLSIVILAGGAARRYGKNKLSVRLPNGQSLLERAVSECLQLGDLPVYVVSGAYHHDLSENIGRKIIEVENPAWESGISTSIRAGLHAVEQQQPACTHLLICLADLPKVSYVGLQQLIEVGRIKPEMQVASYWAEHCSAPALFPRKFWPSLHQLTGDRGAGRLLQAGLFQEPATTFPVPHIEAAWDIDTPDALKEL